MLEMMHGGAQADVVHSLTFHALTEEQHGKDGNDYTPLPCLIRVGYTTLPPGRTPLTSVHPLPDRVPITQVQQHTPR